jgi:hypothetical protein
MRFHSKVLAACLTDSKSPLALVSRSPSEKS